MTFFRTFFYDVFYEFFLGRWADGFDYPLSKYLEHWLGMSFGLLKKVLDQQYQSSPTFLMQILVFNV